MGLIIMFKYIYLVGVLGQEWESAELHTRTPYKAYVAHEIEADIGMRIGLASVNVTLKSKSLYYFISCNIYVL